MLKFPSNRRFQYKQQQKSSVNFIFSTRIFNLATEIVANRKNVLTRKLKIRIISKRGIVNPKLEKE